MSCNCIKIIRDLKIKNDRKTKAYSSLYDDYYFLTEKIIKTKGKAFLAELLNDINNPRFNPERIEKLKEVERGE